MTRKAVKPVDPNALKILIVDTSRGFRDRLEQVLHRFGHVHVAASVWSREMAERALAEHEIDVVLLDMELPRNAGMVVLEAVKDWNRRHPHRGFIGVIMMSSHSLDGVEAVMEALQHGAFDFVAKPETGLSDHMIRQRLKKDLQPRLQHVRRVLKQQRHEALTPKEEEPQEEPVSHVGDTTRFGVVLIGASTGGPKALNQFLPALCRVTSLPILLVQHMPAVFTASMAQSLNRRCDHHVVEMQKTMPIKNNHVYLAAGGRHMLVHRDHQKRLVVQPGDGAPENSCRPAVDVLFRTAAHYYGKRALAVVLTGMGHDGALGAAALAGVGAPILVQDKDSSVVWGMPGSVVEAGLPCDVYSLSVLPHAIKKILYG